MTLRTDRYRWCEHCQRYVRTDHHRHVTDGWYD